jgi:hypothetical protein
MTPPTIPARSRSNHLARVELGTRYVESLTRYLARLAEAHCLATKTLVTQEALPRLAKL